MPKLHIHLRIANNDKNDQNHENYYVNYRKIADFSRFSNACNFEQDFSILTILSLN